MSRFFITGDTHRTNDIEKIIKFKYAMGDVLTRDDYLIVCGDMGICWYGNEEDESVKRWFESMPWTTLFVPGNHENYTLLNTIPTSEWNVGNVKFVSPHCICLLKGETYNINGTRFLACGGAMSIDKWCRKEGVSIWEKDEIFSVADMNNAIKNLDKIGNDVDFVISHTAPSHVVRDMFFCHDNYDESCRNLEEVEKHMSFDTWFFGHWHIDANSQDGTYMAMFNTIVEVGMESDT